MVLLVARCGLAARCDVDVGTGEDDDWRPPSTVEVVLQAQSIIYGHVRRTIPDHSYDFGHGSLVYTAEMDVFCTLKGRRLHSIVNVSKAGSVTRLYDIPSCSEARNSRSQFCRNGLRGVLLISGASDRGKQARPETIKCKKIA